MKKLFFLLCVGVLLLKQTGCSNQPKTETIIQKVPVLKASSIYKPEMVYDYQQAHGDFHEEMAASYLAKAKEAEDTNLQKAIYYTKRAITLQPTLAYYKQLAALLFKTEQHEELLDLYSLIVLNQADRTTKKDTPMYLFGTPDEDLMYEALAASILNKDYRTYTFIDEAKRLKLPLEGFKKKMLADSRLQFTANSDEYKNLMFYFMREEEIEAYVKSESNFRNFISSFKDSSSVFEIGQKEVTQFDYSSFYEEDMEGYSASQFFVHFLPEKQEKPENWFVYELKRKVKINDRIQAVVYAVDSSEAGSPVEMRHIYYRLVTYNKKGQIVQTLVVAEQNGEHLSTLQFSKNQFLISDFKRTWKNPYRKKDFDNFLVKTELTGERRYEIRPDGSILSAVAPSAQKADTLVAQAVSPD